MSIDIDRGTGLPGVRKAVESLKPYVPGVSLETVQRERGIGEVIKLNQNENPLGPSPRAVAAAAQALAESHTYPEGTSRVLREKLGVAWDLPAEWFLVGNGSDEVFRLLAETYLRPDDRIVVPQPSFAGYPLVGELMGAEVLRVPLAAFALDLEAMTEAALAGHARMVFLCRPNSPTGTVFPEGPLRAMMDRLPSDTLVVLDEAYREYDDSAFATRDLVLAYPNLVVSRTFSKIYGMAGFRLGYGIMQPEILDYLYRIRDPFSVNSMALAGGLAALDDREHLERSREVNRAGKAFLYDLFQRLAISYVPTHSNFILFDSGRPAVEVYDAMLSRGVLIRPCASFGLPTYLRVTIGTAEQNERFAQALEDVLSDR